MKIKALILTLIAMISSFALFSCFSNNNDDDYGEGTPIPTVYLNVHNPDGYSSEYKFNPHSDFDANDVNNSIYIPFHAHLYDFDGYYTEKNGQGMKVCDAEGNITREFNDYCLENTNTQISIYPNAMPKKCTITFINPYGEVPEPIVTDCDKYVDLPMEISRTGYRFRGWSEYSTDWTGSDYINTGATEFTLYAIFEPLKINVYCEGAPAGEKSVTVEYDADFTFKYKDRNGYNFVGYFSEEDGRGTQYTDDTGKSIAPWSVAITDYSTVYVYPYYVPAEQYTVYIPNDYLQTYVTVTYVDFYGIGSGQNLEKTYSNSIPIKFIAPQKLPTGHVFEGWYLDSALTKKFHYDKPISEDLILYPKTYKPSTYLASFGYTQIDSDQTHVRELGTYEDRQMSFMCTYSGYLTITVSVEGPDAKQLTVSYSKNNSGGNMMRLYGVDSGTWRIQVKEEDILKIYLEGYAGENESQKVTVSFTELGMKDKVAEVAIPEVFTVSVTGGNRYTLPTNPNSTYKFMGYYTEENGKGTRLTDAEGNSLADYQFDSDIYAYGYYVKEE